MNAIEELIAGDWHEAGRRPHTTVLVQRGWQEGMHRLRAALAAADAGDCVVYAIPLNTPLPRRMNTVLTLRLQLRQIARAIVDGGGQLVGTYGVDPSLETPACVFELNSVASAYADRCLRPRGSAERLRRILVRWFGCDPALGGVLVVGRKP
jgi:hypothetical protein